MSVDDTIGPIRNTDEIIAAPGQDDEGEDLGADFEIDEFADGIAVTAIRDVRQASSRPLPGYNSKRIPLAEGRYVTSGAVPMSEAEGIVPAD